MRDDAKEWFEQRGIIVTQEPTLNGPVYFEPTIRFYGHVVLNSARIGAYTYMAPSVEVIDAQIGRYCSIGGQAAIGLSIHPMTGISTSAAFYDDVFGGGHTGFQQTKPIRIGHDVWIGRRATILGGVNIGTGAIVAAGAVVVKDVPPYAVVAGNPGVVKKFRFDAATIDALLASKWWRFDLVKARASGIDLSSDDPMAAISRIQKLAQSNLLTLLPNKHHALFRDGGNLVFRREV